MDRKIVALKPGQRARIMVITTGAQVNDTTTEEVFSFEGPGSLALLFDYRESRFVQVKSPTFNRYRKVDMRDGIFYPVKRSPGPYKGIPIHKASSEEV